MSKRMSTSIEIIKSLATLHGFKLKELEGLSKTDIIRRIQIKEGNNPCFATRFNCSQLNCLWYGDCCQFPIVFDIKD